MIFCKEMEDMFKKIKRLECENEILKWKYD